MGASKSILGRLNDPAVIRQALRVALRSLPLVPGPELYDLAAMITKSQSALDAQISEAVDALRKSASLITNLELQMKERTEKLGALQDEHKRLTALSTVTADQVTALATQINLAIGRSKKWDWAVALIINLAAGFVIFILGVFLSDTIKHLFS